MFEQVDYSLDKDWLMWGKRGVQKWMLSAEGSALVATNPVPLSSQQSGWANVPPLPTRTLATNESAIDGFWHDPMESWDQTGTEAFSWDVASPLLPVPVQGNLQVS